MQSFAAVRDDDIQLSAMYHRQLTPRLLNSGLTHHDSSRQSTDQFVLFLKLSCSYYDSCRRKFAAREVNESASLALAMAATRTHYP